MAATSKRTVLILLNIAALFLLTDSRNQRQPYDRHESARITCSRTMYPSLCAETLSAAAAAASTSHDEGDLFGCALAALIQTAINETLLPLPATRVNATLFATQRAVIDSCEDLVSMSVGRLNQALAAVKISPEDHKSDIAAWLSAAITFFQTCDDEIEIRALPNHRLSEIRNKMERVSQLVSNPLALVNLIAGNRSTTARRDGFPGWTTAKQRKLLQSTAIRADVVVSKDGSGNFTTVTEAIAAASGGGRFVIYVKSGVYYEYIVCRKFGITLIGDGKYSTIISGSRSVGAGSSLLGSSTFTIHGDGFIAKDIGFENLAGPQNQQAVALAVTSDRSVFYRCSVSGYQDTLYALSLRQFYRECDVRGTIDFIFGNAAAVFQSSTLILRIPRGPTSFNAILANGRTDPGQITGFSVHNCRIVAGSDFAPVANRYESYLGRPWKAYSRAAILHSEIDAVISKRGWIIWDGASSSTYSTLYFAEYGNMGYGADTSGRVTWPGFHVIGVTEATRFTVAAFIGGDLWLPPTGVAFVSGL